MRQLITVLGATGAGKSKLAVDLACALNGEVINGDAMQMYKGFDVITNKIPIEERNNIPHHLMDFVDIKDDIIVSSWVQGAKDIIKQISDRGKVPILVGGTHYYLQNLLFEDTQVHDAAFDQVQSSTNHENRDNSKEFPILNAPTNEIMAELRRLDPIMADRWHPNDRRKIRRSLEICLTTNKKVSDIYEEQRTKRADADNLFPSNFENLFFWVHSTKETLNNRLDARIHSMFRNGMFSEIAKMERLYQNGKASGNAPDITRGVWQSIGWKECRSFFEAPCIQDAASKDIDDKSQDGLVSDDNDCATFIVNQEDCQEKLKIANRQYARTQLRWIRVKLMNRILSTNSKLPGYGLYLLDSSDSQQWDTTVLQPALDIARKFTRQEYHSLPLPKSLSELANEMLSPLKQDMSTDSSLWIKRFCEVCKVTTVDNDTWIAHINSRSHRSALRKREKHEHGEFYKLMRKQQAMENRVMLESKNFTVSESAAT